MPGFVKRLSKRGMEEGEKRNPPYAIQPRENGNEGDFNRVANVL